MEKFKNQSWGGGGNTNRVGEGMLRLIHRGRARATVNVTAHVSESRRKEGGGESQQQQQVYHLYNSLNLAIII